MNEKMYYFDHSATTQPSVDSVNVFTQVAQTYYANPSSIHAKGEEVRQLLTQARQQIATILAFDEKDIYFTASGTEANQWVFSAVVSALRQRHLERQRIIVSAVEHPSVMTHVERLIQDGYDVQICPVDQDGALRIDALATLLEVPTLLVSTMAVNNEVGTIQPLADIAALLSQHPQVAWHVDAVQAVTTQLRTLHEPRIDLLTLSSHKFHALRGTGILAKKARIPSDVYVNGGGQEAGLRSGTENVPSIVATARALRMAYEANDQTQALAQYRQQIVACLKANGWQVFGGNQTSAHIICAALAGIPGEVLVHAFEVQQLIVSTTSACSSRKHQAHSTLQAMGVPSQISTSAIRISLSTTTQATEVAHLIRSIPKITQQFQR